MSIVAKFVRSTPAKFALAAGALALSVGAVAQTAADASAVGPANDEAVASPTAIAALNLPQGPTQFLATDPNLRRATARVNGDIVTGTDIEQRLALIVAASETKPLSLIHI